EAQMRNIAVWFRETASSQRDESRLADFFENVLNSEERDHLMSLAGDDLDRELTQMYMAYLMKPNWRSDQPRRGDWQGPGRPRPNGPRGSGGIRRTGAQADREPLNGGSSPLQSSK